ncbi:MAG: hypothetical protein ING66_06730 [Rhodocyclaceae bacterium]|nr:hypothetical protein [Rhodocyclaceae bacterium]MCA3020187.1 hypothetical protein [Rhodocyclaceae bacterium]MCA3020764.1 hypothetical protein [Rhodocyclaceae bacterium]MCA3024562.1 hypothetical protein [Rhodocyclaceae bacterium]MCA3028276.1 hypothetical protein [Rhodocyclaceae bacterium]
MSTARQQPCLGRIGVAAVCAWLLLTPVGSAAADLLKPTDLDSPGAIALRKLSKDVINAPKPKRFSLEAQREQERSAASNTEDILVLADRETDDVISKRVGMAAFRDRLARERPSTPKEKVQRALCFIGLCAVEPVENTAFTRAEQGTDKSSLELSKQFRGTLQ